MWLVGDRENDPVTTRAWEGARRGINGNKQRNIIFTLLFVSRCFFEKLIALIDTMIDCFCSIVSKRTRSSDPGRKLMLYDIDRC